VSAGQVESAWPSGPTPDDSLIAIAAAHIAKPAPPMLKTQRILDNSTNPSDVQGQPDDHRASRPAADADRHSSRPRGRRRASSTQ